MNRLATLLLALLLCSCATSTLGKIGQIQAGVTGVRKQVTTVLDDRCMAASLKCPKGELETCKGWTDCRDLRRALYASADGIQIQLDMATSFAAAGDDKKALTYFNAACKSLEELEASLRKYGILELIGGGK